jgi:hypothetical protein
LIFTLQKDLSFEIEHCITIHVVQGFSKYFGNLITVLSSDMLFDSEFRRLLRQITQVAAFGANSVMQNGLFPAFAVFCPLGTTITLVKAIIEVRVCWPNQQQQEQQQHPDPHPYKRSHHGLSSCTFCNSFFRSICDPGFAFHRDMYSLVSASCKKDHPKEEREKVHRS